MAYRAGTGDIICLLDADDMFRPTKVECVVEAFRSTPAAGLVYHRFQPSDADGRPVGVPFPRDLETGWLRDVALRRGGWGPNTVASVLSFRREFANLLFPLPEHVGGFGDALIHGVAQLLVAIEALPDALTMYRIHGRNDSGTHSPGLAHVRRMADARRDTFVHIQVVAGKVLGESVARTLRLEDIPSYWEYLAALFVMSGRPRSGVHGYGPEEILHHLPPTPRAVIWRGLFRLPDSLGRAVLRLWWANARWKRYSRPITRWLGLG
jgi:hypothetical protein